ncbi:MAG: helix-turn-helix transcriptional regulator [Kiritimatiellia bacterium]
MKIDALLTDDAVLAELGQRLARRRIDMGLTQEELAREAGVSKRTLERMESGSTAQMKTVLRVLRVLDLMSRLESLLPERGPSPMELLKQQGKARQRASSRVVRESAEPWQWGDEK